MAPLVARRVFKPTAIFLFLALVSLAMEILISRKAFLSALAGAKSAHPNEFVCLFVGRRESGNIMIDDTLIPPGIMVSEEMSSFSDWMMPVIDGMIGTFHSHPGGISRPSKEDRWLFSQKGGVHFIAAEPYGKNDVTAYLGSGKRCEFRVV